MITPIEIQSKTFKSGGLGYDKKDVDNFFKEVLKSYEVVYRENMEYQDKINVLTEGIQYYKSIEKTLQKALVLAEKTAEETRIASLKKAKSIEMDARTRGQMIVADAKNDLERIHAQTVKLLQQYEVYKAQFEHLASAQLQVLNSDAFQIQIANLDVLIDDSNKTSSEEIKDQQTDQSHDLMNELNQKAAQENVSSSDSYLDEAALTKEEDKEEDVEENKNKPNNYITDEKKEDEFSFFNLDDDED